ncbi:MAG: hypothetical protein GXO48_08615 [Chlorobi bacterium]|nr:hypothetical protein [Chlorobiota bacterium]
MEQVGLITGWIGVGLIAFGIYNAERGVWRWLRRGIREIIEIPYAELGTVLPLVIGSLLVIMSMFMHLFPNSPEVSLAVPMVFAYRLVSHLYSRWLSDSREPLKYLSEEWQAIIWLGFAGMFPSLVPTDSLLGSIREGLIYVAFGIGALRWLNGLFKSVPYLIKYHLYYLIYLCNVEVYPLLGIWSLSIVTDLFAFNV